MIMNQGGTTFQRLMPEPKPPSTNMGEVTARGEPGIALEWNEKTAGLGPAYALAMLQNALECTADAAAHSADPHSLVHDRRLD